MVDKVFKVCRYCLTTNCPFLISLGIKYCDYIFKILLLKWIALIHYYLIDALKNHAESVFSYISPLFKNIFFKIVTSIYNIQRGFSSYIFAFQSCEILKRRRIPSLSHKEKHAWPLTLYRAFTVLRIICMSFFFLLLFWYTLSYIQAKQN